MSGLEGKCDALLASLVGALRAASSLPKGADFNYYKTASQPFKSKTKAESSRVLASIGAIVQREDQNGWDFSADAVVDADEYLESMSDACDVLIERVEMSIDQAKGVPRQDAMFVNPHITFSMLGGNPDENRKKRSRIVHANIPLPQLSFKDKVDNSATPFKPKLTSKPNAIVPLKLELLTATNTAMDQYASSIGLNDAPQHYYPHPYEHEIKTAQPQSWQLQEVSNPSYPPLEETLCSWIDTPAELEEVARKLDQVTEIAIDLEAHAYRSYQGFVCLMQISTRTEDFLIDTLELRSHLQILNSSFTNPKILKVLHGADGDVVWLQRDFGLYLVNMFDTGQAMRVLRLPKFSLAYLLKHLCNINANKTYQLADWRIRPLSADMLHYAREDTHYLLYMADRLRNDLLAQGEQTLLSVYKRSQDICLFRYEKPQYSDESGWSLLKKHNRPFSNTQNDVFLALNAWRDRVAREEDESVRFVLPDHMMFELADQLPRDTQQVQACCRPTPTIVRARLHLIVELIRDVISRASSSAFDHRDSSFPAALNRHHQSNTALYYSDDTKDSFFGTAEEAMDKGDWVLKYRVLDPMDVDRSFFHDDDEDDDEDEVYSSTHASVMASFKVEALVRPLSPVNAGNVGEVQVAHETAPVEPDPTNATMIRDVISISKMKKSAGKKSKKKKGGEDTDDESVTNDDNAEAHAVQFDADNDRKFMNQLGWQQPTEGFRSPQQPFDYGASQPAFHQERPHAHHRSFNPTEGSQHDRKKSSHGYSKR